MSLEAALAQTKTQSFVWMEFLRLTKPRLTLVALSPLLLSFYMANPGALDGMLLGHALFAAALVGAGANALNQYLERDIDSKMRRTEGRPLPSRRLSEGAALLFGVSVSFAGVLYFLFKVDSFTSFLAVMTLVFYLFLYTPLKLVTPWNTLVGAVAGAAPTLMGWSAARGGNLDGDAWFFFAILFLWQLPHFLAIAWVYRQDYAAGGVRVLTLEDKDGSQTGKRIFWLSLLLVGTTLLPTLVGLTGHIHLALACVAGISFLAFAAFLSIKKMAGAKPFVSASIVYLLVLVASMMADKI